MYTKTLYLPYTTPPMDLLTNGGFIKGILRGVRCTKSLRVHSFYIDGPPPGPLLYCTQEQYSSLMNPPLVLPFLCHLSCTLSLSPTVSIQRVHCSVRFFWVIFCWCKWRTLHIRVSLGGGGIITISCTRIPPGPMYEYVCDFVQNLQSTQMLTFSVLTVLHSSGCIFADYTSIVTLWVVMIIFMKAIQTNRTCNSTVDADMLAGSVQAFISEVFSYFWQDRLTG